ncbi:MAG: AhpC/TSA family protein [Muribaculaceae bacterium]|nr:AhpC/TSA family protein [Muribaculaceae bacterium]
MRFTHLFMAVAALATASMLHAEQYRVIVPLSDDMEGAMARLVNFDNGVTIDSVLVEDKAARFEGNIDDAILARVLVDGVRQPVFILEPGTVSFNAAEGAFGTMLNDQLRALGKQLGAAGAQYQAATDDAGRQAAYARYNALLDSAMTANTDNVLGYYIFLNGEASGLDAKGLRELFAKYPAFAGYERSKKMLEMAERREATQPGGKYIDFSVTQPDGKVVKLSDYVGKGKYTLVDFWASWCGPCIRQTAVLKDIYNKYKDSGRLDVLGVAVWDEVDATRRAIKDHDLPWDCILDAQTIPTDLYGITGIPCIILFGPDGTILSRDKQDDELRADVDAALAR